MNKKAKTRTNNKKNIDRIPKLKFKYDKFIFVGLIILIFGVCAYFSYRYLGKLASIVALTGLLIIFGIAQILDRIKSKKRKKRILNTIFIVIFTLAIIGVLGGGGFIYYVVKTAPEFNTNNLITKESTIVYDANNNEIAKLGAQFRENISYSDLSEVLIDALIATEDSRYFQHNGFDIARFIKASIGQVLGQADAGGGSTISMQVIKNSFTSSNSSGIAGIIRKFTDIYLAVFKLEKQYTKEEIIEFYTNNHYLGGIAWGVEQASQYYFGKSCSDLNLAEASLIAGLYQAPGAYNPYDNPKDSAKRRETVLYLMYKHGYISKEEADLANSIPIESLLVGKGSTDSEFQGYIDTAIAEVQKRYKVNAYTTPMLIYTNMNTEKQKALNNVFNGTNYGWISEYIQAGTVAVDTNSGKIIAIGTGRNRTDLRGWNFATDINKQIGSTAKPLFDYGPGIEYNNWSTYTLFDDSEYAYTSGKEIVNFDGQYLGIITLRTALANSRNIPALKAFQQLDKKQVLAFVQSLGIKPEVSGGTIHEAHAIGAFNGASPVQLAGAYAAFSNGGNYHEPYSVNKVVFRDTGEEETYEPKKVQVMSDATAFMITDVLKGGVGWRMQINGVNQAAKTGTTNYPSETWDKYPTLNKEAIPDAWVVGFSPNISIALWYGYESLDPEHLDRVLLYQASVYDRQFLYNAIGNAVFDKNYEDFKVPSSVVKVGVEMGSDPAKLPSKNTPAEEIVYEYFKKGTEPTEISTKYAILDNVTNLNVEWLEKNKSVKLSWVKASDAGLVSSDTFGYYIYFDDKLVGFTEKNIYTIDDLNDYDGVFTIKTSYKTNKSFISSGTKCKLPDYYEYKLDLSTEKSIIVLKNSTWVDDPSPFILYEEDIDITNKVVSYTTNIYDSKGALVTTGIDTSKEETYKIKYTVIYKNYTGTITKNIIVQEEASD